MISHEPLHLAWRNFAWTCRLLWQHIKPYWYQGHKSKVKVTWFLVCFSNACYVLNWFGWIHEMSFARQSCCISGYLAKFFILFCCLYVCYLVNQDAYDIIYYWSVRCITSMLLRGDVNDAVDWFVLYAEVFSVIVTRYTRTSCSVSALLKQSLLLELCITTDRYDKCLHCIHLRTNFVQTHAMGGPNDYRRSNLSDNLNMNTTNI